MKFGLLSYEYGKNRYKHSINLGDEIQSIAASYFLPQIDFLIDREEISEKSIKVKDKIKVIMNGWYMHDYKEWPPASNIEPLLISIHFTDDKRFLNNVFSKNNIKYLVEHGPVGARDIETLNLLKKYDVPSYFSGCLTLTLPPRKSVKRNDYVICVDLPDKIVNYLKKKTERPIYCVSPGFKIPFFNETDKFDLALNLLTVYQSAHAVITTRLHTAMPCLALGTPVLLVDKTDGNEIRFSGLSDLVNTIGEKSYLNNLDYFDVDNPTANSNKFLKFRKDLIKKCEEFTGCKHREDFPLQKAFSLEECITRNFAVMYNANQNMDLSKYINKKDVIDFLKSKI